MPTKVERRDALVTVSLTTVADGYDLIIGKGETTKAARRQAVGFLRRELIGLGPTPRQLPRYRCHREVQALKIRRIMPLEDGAATLHFDGDFRPVRVGRGFRLGINTTNTGAGHTDCGYYVVYPDGYTRWESTAAFEEGYTEIFADGTDTVVDPAGTVRGEPIPNTNAMRRE